MIEQLLHLFLAVFLTAVLYPFWINFVYKYHMGEEIRSDGPSTHLVKKGTPTMGGMVFILVVAIITFAFNSSRTQTLFPVVVASMAALFGIIEDFTKIYKNLELKQIFRLNFNLFGSSQPSKLSKIIFYPWHLFTEFWRVVGSSEKKGGLQTYHKFMIQASIAGFVSYWTYFKLGWDYIWMPLIGNINIGILYPFLIFFLFIVVLNSVAFTDGLDGLAGGLSLIAIGAFWVVATLLGYNSLATFCATFVGALIPFLYFNVFPARVFMGNVGSHVLGAIIALLAVVMHREIILIFVAGVFLIDGISSPLQQLSVKFTGKRIFRMAPLHHHFEMLGWPENKVTNRFWLAGIMLAFIGIFVALL